MSEPAKKPCRCTCGYRCGGPGRCKLPMQECLSATDGKHFVRDCEHRFSGWEDDEDGLGGSAACVVCGLSALDHDLLFGP